MGLHAVLQGCFLQGVGANTPERLLGFCRPLPLPISVRNEGAGTAAALRPTLFSSLIGSAEADDFILRLPP